MEKLVKDGGLTAKRRDEVISWIYFSNSWILIYFIK